VFAGNKATPMPTDENQSNLLELKSFLRFWRSESNFKEGTKCHNSAKFKLKLGTGSHFS
jgi:hypothetical protein